MWDKIIIVSSKFILKEFWFKSFKNRIYRNINKIEDYHKFKFKEFRLTSFSKPTESD